MYNREQLKTTAHEITQPLVNIFVKANLSPNLFTALGLGFNVVAAIVFVLGSLYGEADNLRYMAWGGFFILLGGLCDVLDGQVARASGKASKFGALFDSVLDRYSELIMFFGMGFYLIANDFIYGSIVLFFALQGSLMVSYTRARAEGLGVNCSVGLMQRPERIVLLAGGAVACGIADVFNLMSNPIVLLTIPIIIVAILATFTAIHRLYHCYQVLRKEK